MKRSLRFSFDGVVRSIEKQLFDKTFRCVDAAASIARSILAMTNTAPPSPKIFARREKSTEPQSPRRGNSGKLADLLDGDFFEDLKIYFCDSSGVSFICAMPHQPSKAGAFLKAIESHDFRFAHACRLETVVRQRFQAI